MRRILAALVMLVAFSAPAPAASQVSPAKQAAFAARPRNLVFMIPDGCGPASMTLARLCADRPLALDEFLTGTCRTASADSRITDSGAAATAYASGLRTKNWMVGVDPDGRPVATLLEAAEARGMATGLVATSRVTHATPACFASHVSDRNAEEEIAHQELEHGIEVILGGGRDFFLPADHGGRRKDGRDLTAEARERGVTVLGSRAELLGPLSVPVLGLFTPGHMHYEIDRDSVAEPSLAEMTRRALDLLAPDPDGFFLMVEGSRIDHAGHQNDPATHVVELLAYDEAVREVLDFARRDGTTLVISVADHETGGLTLGRDNTGEGMDLHPAFLRNVTASAERIAARIRTGEDAATVLSAVAGIDSLSVADSSRIGVGLAADGDLADAVATVISARAGLGWTTHSHTGVDVNLYAAGPGSERIGGCLANDEVGRRAAEAMGFDLVRLAPNLR